MDTVGASHVKNAISRAYVPQEQFHLEATYERGAGVISVGGRTSVVDSIARIFV